MFIYRIYFLFSFLVLIHYIVEGQDVACTFRINGMVIDVSDSQPLAYATIYLQEAGKGTTSNESGEFSLQDVCPGEWHVVVSHLGCESKTFFLRVQSDTTITWMLDHQATVLDVIEVQATSSQSRAGRSHYTLGQDAILEAGNESISVIASRVPGVRILKTGPGLGKPVINGFTGNRISVLQNGVPLESQQWGNDHAPEIDPMTGDRMYVSTGAESVRYGASSLGGIVRVEPVFTDFDPHWHGIVKTSYQTNGRKIGVFTLLKKNTAIGRLRLAGSVNAGGDQSTPSYYLTNTGQRMQSVSMLLANSEKAKDQRYINASFYASEQGLLSGAHPGSLTDLEEALTRTVPLRTRDTFSYSIHSPRQSVKHFFISLDQKFVLDQDKYIRIKAGWQANSRKEFDIRRGGRDAKPTLDLLLWSQFYDVALMKELPGQAGQWQAGLQYRYANNTNLPGTGVSPLIPDYIQQQTAIYAIRQWKANEWQYELGSRLEARWYNTYIIRANQTVSNTRKQFNLLAFNAGCKKNIVSTAITRTDLSITVRPPDIHELYSQGLHQGVSGIEEGDANLKAEKAFRLSHEWQLSAAKSHHIHATVFYQYIDNFIYLKPDSVFRLTVRGAFPVFQYTGADVSMTGMTLAYSWTIHNHWSFSQQADYIHATKLSTKQGLIRIPPFMVVSGIQYFNDKISWCKEVKGILESRFTARQTHVSETDDFVAPPHAYWLVNGSLRVKWKHLSGRDIDIVFRVENILNNKYRDYMNRLRYFADEAGRNFMFTIQYPL